MKLSKELLKEIYNSVDETLKAKIEIEAPEMKAKIEIGKWQNIETVQGFKFIHFVTEIEDETILGYGFNFELNIYYNNSVCILDEIKSISDATPEEVETALVNEAKRRGFKEGVKCISLLSPDGEEILKSDFQFQSNNLWIDSNEYKCCIFKNGKWATIINEPNEKELLIEKANKVEAELVELKKQINEIKD